MAREWKAMKISDDIRNGFLRRDDVGTEAYRKLLYIADRIDREMVELPKDADGRMVPLDTKELYDANGKNVNVTSFTFSCDAYGNWRYWKVFSPDVRGDDGMLYVDGLHLIQPDSLGRIADELEEKEGER